VLSLFTSPMGLGVWNLKVKMGHQFSHNFIYMVKFFEAQSFITLNFSNNFGTNIVKTLFLTAWPDNIWNVEYYVTIGMRGATICIWILTFIPYLSYHVFWKRLSGLPYLPGDVTLLNDIMIGVAKKGFCE
jgi:hypothetical protein